MPRKRAGAGGRARGSGRPWTGRRITVEIALGLFLVGAIAVVVAALAVMSAGRAYVHAESRWSKAQQEAVFHLDRYAETGDAEELRAARAALEVPLGDRRARLALAGDRYDYEAARAGFRRGDVPPDDIPAMIFLFEYFERAPYLREAIAIWRRGDRLILELRSMADEMEAAWQRRPPDRSTLRELRPRLERMDERLRRYETRFSSVLNDGMRRIRTGLIAICVVTIAILAAAAAWRFRATTRSIAASRRRFWAAFEGAPVGVGLVSRDGRFREVNGALCRILDRPRGELAGSPVDGLAHGENRASFESLRERLGASETESVTVEQRYVRPDGGVIWGKLTLTPTLDGESSGDSFIAVLEDVSEARQLSEKLSHEASHDPLTGLPNRRQFEADLRDGLKQAHRERSGHVLGFIDLDQFKLVNDTCGHNAGDALLRQVAEVMESSLRARDVLARIGGDEFGFLLYDCPLDAGLHVAEKLRAQVADFTFTWGERSFPLSVSTGLVELDGRFVGPAAALQMADTACYVAKENGRDRIEVYAHEDEGGATHRAHGEMEWVGRLKTGLDEGRLELWAQPIVDLHGPGKQRYEILLRFRDEAGRLHLPGSFLPPAERYGMAATIDRWVMERVCATLRDHPEHVAALDACHVNLSGRSLSDNACVASIEQSMAGRGAGEASLSSLICLEVNESAALENLADARSVLGRFRELGCRLALDDFGRGLSSFGYLKWLPIEYVKIDGGFVREMSGDRFDRAVVRAISELTRIRGVATIAEWVEAEAAIEQLRGFDVDYLQGSALGEPRPWHQLLRAGD